MPAAPASARPLGDSRVIAAVPFPGYPEGIAVHEGIAYTSGPAAFGVPGNFVPSNIYGIDLATRQIVKTITVQGQPGPLNALSCLTFGEGDNLFVIEENMGVLKINVTTGQQSVYAAPFYPVYQSAYAPPVPLLINDLAFDKKGNLYITDSFQATIWRVPPGGGAPQVWFQGAMIDGIFGPNGVRVHPKEDKLYFVVSLDGTGQGYVYTLPLVDHPTAADLKLVTTYAPGTVPDGIAFGKSGQLYVALAGTSQISVLRPDGSEAVRYSGPAKISGGTALPWANPANIAFNDQEGTLLVTNHAGLVPNPEPLFAVFDVYVGDQAGRMFKDKPVD